MKLDDKLFLLSFFFVLIFSIISIWRSYEIKNNPFLNAPIVDIKLIENQVKSGNLSIHKAKFFKFIKE